LRALLRARAAFFAYGGVSGAHHRESLRGVSCFQRLVIGIRDLSRLAIELQLAKGVDCQNLSRLDVPSFPRRAGEVLSKKR
jgi:hypothetical protein